jgi:hypothetical protein
MKKVCFGLTCVLGTIIATISVVNNFSLWETVDIEKIKGGICYVTSENPTGYCQDDTCDCNKKECKWVADSGYWTCDATRALEKLTNSWRTNISTSETGHKSYVNTTIVCHNVYTCNYDQSVPNCIPMEVQGAQVYGDPNPPPTVIKYYCVNSGPSEPSIPKTHRYVDVTNTPVCN